jgi:hypothetical protein
MGVGVLRGAGWWVMDGEWSVTDVLGTVAVCVDVCGGVCVSVCRCMWVCGGGWMSMWVCECVCMRGSSRPGVGVSWGGDGSESVVDDGDDGGRGRLARLDSDPVRTYSTGITRHARLDVCDELYRCFEFRATFSEL